MKRARVVVAAVAFLVLTVAFGVAMRWEQATAALSARGFSFVFVRHAHSHAGFYGLLTLASWVATSQQQRLRGAFIAGYAGCALVTSLLFAVWGYRVATIVLSSVIAASWLWAAWCQRTAMSRDTWSARALLVLGVGTLLIPAIAVSAKHDPLLSRRLAHLFIAWLLLGLFVPAAWDALGVRRDMSLRGYLAAVALGLVHTVFGDVLPAWSAAGAVIAAVVVGRVVVLMHAPLAARALWSLIPLSLLAAVVPPLRSEAWRIVGVHVWILAVVLPAFATAIQAPTAPPWAFVPYAATLAAMLVTLAVPLATAWQLPPSAVAMTSTVFAVVAALTASWLAARVLHSARTTSLR